MAVKATIKKLIVKQFKVTKKDFHDPTRRLQIGETYTYFQDPKTGKYYNPKKSFKVTGENLADLFTEVSTT
uniref:Uncharacterized protein n=1 Tax=viral metagenome TaxID=1070528 RepID=A0A6H1Z9Y0_9ZZZZ